MFQIFTLDKLIYKWRSFAHTNVNEECYEGSDSTTLSVGGWQGQPTACYCTACKLRMVFTFFDGPKKSRRESDSLTWGNYAQFQFQCP